MKSNLPIFIIGIVLIVLLIPLIMVFMFNPPVGKTKEEVVEETFARKYNYPVEIYGVYSDGNEKIVLNNDGTGLLIAADEDELLSYDYDKQSGIIKVICGEDYFELGISETGDAISKGLTKYINTNENPMDFEKE